MSLQPFSRFLDTRLAFPREAFCSPEYLITEITVRLLASEGALQKPASIENFRYGRCRGSRAHNIPVAVRKTVGYVQPRRGCFASRKFAPRVPARKTSESKNGARTDDRS